jgi:hypothetical protein
VLPDIRKDSQEQTAISIYEGENMASMGNMHMGSIISNIKLFENGTRPLSLD